MAVNFRKKITSLRPFPKGQTPTEDLNKLLLAYESDRGRIINSAAIRRLQQKTQVFPLERNAAVRSRLTHSMEVQQVGRFIVQTIFRELGHNRCEALGLDGLERHIESLVEMSCLMHDIGNPPFGHFGEEAIKSWFIQNIKDLAKCAKVQLTDVLITDICAFEGNAQAIRLVHQLLRLNLTYSQVAGILKYTRCGKDVRPGAEAQDRYLKKKVGFYYSERKYVEALCDANEMRVGQRHPIAYIMEAADDISYCIADLEDAIEKNIFSTKQLSRELILAFDDQITLFQAGQSAGLNTSEFEAEKALIDEKLAELERLANQGRDSDFTIKFRIELIHPLVKHASKRFIDNIESVYQGNFNQALLEDQSASHGMAEAMKSVARKFVFCHPEVEQRELQGYKIISGLLETYKPLLQLSYDEFDQVLAQHKKAPLLAKRLVKKLSSKHVRAYKGVVERLSNNAEMEFYFRCRLIQDYISGMTDQFAYDEFRMMNIID